MSTDIKLSKAQICEIVQSGGSFSLWLGNLVKTALTNITIPLARDNLRGLASNLISNWKNKFVRKISEKELLEQGKDLPYLFWMKLWLILLKS